MLVINTRVVNLYLDTKYKYKYKYKYKKNTNINTNINIVFVSRYKYKYTRYKYSHNSNQHGSRRCVCVCASCEVFPHNWIARRHYRTTPFHPSMQDPMHRSHDSLCPSARTFYLVARQKCLGLPSGRMCC